MFSFGKKEIVRDEASIDAVLSRGVEGVFPNRENAKKAFLSGKQLTFYLGIDPTGPTLHLGHLIPLKKLGELQKLGHQIIFLIGDMTAMIGDPTDKTATRKKLTREQVLENCAQYKEQASKFISFSGANKALFKYNSEWLGKMDFADVLELASNMTVQQMLKRDMFDNRMKAGEPIHIHEFLYPLMQGYDSVAMDVDGEVGGNDQTFNMLAGRDLLRTFKDKEKYVIATKLLVDSSGKKMGKTEGNMVSLDQTPEDVFGKVMSWTDNLIIPGFEIITDVPLTEIAEIKKSLDAGANPRDAKVRLAREVTALIHDVESAEAAQRAFEKTFSKGGIPDEIQEIEVAHGSHMKDALVKEGIVSSNTDWRRLVESRAVSYAGTDDLISDSHIKAEKDVTLRIGKKRFVKIIVK